MRLARGLYGAGKAAGPLAAAGLLLACFALWAPTAHAAAPPNDEFANREVLNGSLPIEVTGTNVEASKEPGEFIGGLSPAGHSVWFEWQATSTGWVTIGNCDSAIRTIVGAFTGTAVNSLIKVVSGNSSEGPHCPATEREFTFKAISGTSYKIAVDGNNFYVPPAGSPPTEGEFALRIEATPPPTNDDFQNATTLEGEAFGEADNRFYWADAFGYNWGATKEAGEPDHAGNPGGASVWYSWTAPVTGIAEVNVCCFFSDLLGIYVGDAVNALTPIAGTTALAIVPVAAGTTYRIAVDGEFDSPETGARAGSFSLSASMRLPSLPPTDGASGSSDPLIHPPPIMDIGPPAIDMTLPRTAIYKRKLAPGKRMATFSFGPSDPGGRFRCKLDGRPFTACSPPVTYKHLSSGQHTFAVAAVDSAGREDPTPEVTRFRSQG